MTARADDPASSKAVGKTAVAYVMTHYPRVALTFISGEIDALERRGIVIHPFAMNAPDRDDLLSDDARSRSERTTYLKTSRRRALGAFVRTAVRHPLATARLVALALSSAGLDAGLAVRRLAHLFQAALLAETCARRGIGHIHAHFGQAPATIAWFASEIMNFHASGSSRWSLTIHGFQDFVDEKVARLDLKAASAAFVICVSDFTRSQLCRITPPRLWDRYQVVRCGIDLKQFPFRADRALHSRPRIVLVGRLSPEKGQLVLIRAVAALRTRGREVEVVLIGAGSLRGWIEDEIASLGLGDLVSLAGELEPAQVTAQLLDSDIFCLPSFAEGLPISIMEAMATGVPVISTFIGGIPELAINGETALTVAAGNVEALADAIEKIIVEPALRYAMIDFARREVVLRHDREKNADQLALYFVSQDAGR